MVGAGCPFGCVQHLSQLERDIMKPLIITLVVLFVLFMLLLTYALMCAAKRGDIMQETINSQRNLDQAEQKTDELE